MSKSKAERWLLTIELYPLIRDAIPMTVTTVVDLVLTQWAMVSSDVIADNYLKEFESNMIHKFGRSHSVRNLRTKRLSGGEQDKPIDLSIQDPPD